MPGGVVGLRDIGGGANASGVSLSGGNGAAHGGGRSPAPLSALAVPSPRFVRADSRDTGGEDGGSGGALRWRPSEAKRRSGGAKSWPAPRPPPRPRPRPAAAAPRCTAKVPGDSTARELTPDREASCAALRAAVRISESEASDNSSAACLAMPKMSESAPDRDRETSAAASLASAKMSDSTPDLSSPPPTPESEVASAAARRAAAKRSDPAAEDAPASDTSSAAL